MEVLLINFLILGDLLRLEFGITFPERGRDRIKLGRFVLTDQALRQEPEQMFPLLELQIQLLRQLDQIISILTIILME